MRKLSLIQVVIAAIIAALVGFYQFSPAMAQEPTDDGLVLVEAAGADAPAQQYPAGSPIPAGTLVLIKGSVPPNFTDVVDNPDNQGLNVHSAVAQEGAVATEDIWTCNDCSRDGTGTDGGRRWVSMWDNIPDPSGGHDSRGTTVDLTGYGRRIQILDAGYSGQASGNDITTLTIRRSDGSTYTFDINPDGSGGPTSLIITVPEGQEIVGAESDDSIVIIDADEPTPPATSTPVPTDSPTGTATPTGEPTGTPVPTETPVPTLEPEPTIVVITVVPPKATPTEEPHQPDFPGDTSICVGTSDTVTAYQNKDLEGGDRWVQLPYAAPDKFGVEKYSLGGDLRPFRIQLRDNQGRVIKTESGADYSEVYEPVLERVSKKGDHRFYEVRVWEWDKVLCVQPAPPAPKVNEVVKPETAEADADEVRILKRVGEMEVGGHTASIFETSKEEMAPNGSMVGRTTLLNSATVYSAHRAYQTGQLWANLQVGDNVVINGHLHQVINREVVQGSEVSVKSGQDLLITCDGDSFENRLVLTVEPVIPNAGQ